LRTAEAAFVAPEGIDVHRNSGDPITWLAGIGGKLHLRFAADLARAPCRPVEFRRSEFLQQSVMRRNRRSAQGR
jgi:hypothetical protein